MASILVVNAAPTVELFDSQWGHKLIADAHAATATAAATTPCSVFTTASSTDDDRPQSHHEHERCWSKSNLAILGVSFFAASPASSTSHNLSLSARIAISYVIH